MAIRLWRTSGKATEEVAAGTRKRIAKATESACVRDRGHGGNHRQPSRSPNPMLLRREANKQTSAETNKKGKASSPRGAGACGGAGVDFH